MKGLGAVLWVLALAAAYGLGAWSSSSRRAGVDSPRVVRGSGRSSESSAAFVRDQPLSTEPGPPGRPRGPGGRGSGGILVQRAGPPPAHGRLDSHRRIGGDGLGALAARYAGGGGPVPRPWRSSPSTTLSACSCPWLPPWIRRSCRRCCTSTWSRGWARSNHRDALTEYLSKQPVSATRLQATTALVTEILKEGSDAVIAWVDAVPDHASNAFKRTAFQRAAYRDRTHRTRAGRALGRWPPRPGLRRRGNEVRRVALGRAGPCGGDGLARIPPRRGRTEPQQVKSTFSRWLKDDAHAAEDWAGSAAPASGVDPAVRVLVRRYLAPRPVLAMEWAHRIHDPTVRIRVLSSVGRAWLRKDRDAFMAWLPESGLESQVEDLILNAPSGDERGRRRRTWDAGSAQVPSGWSRGQAPLPPQ